jgi:hypothetical protein
MDKDSFYRKCGQLSALVSLVRLAFTLFDHIRLSQANSLLPSGIVIPHPQSDPLQRQKQVCVCVCVCVDVCAH